MQYLKENRTERLFPSDMKRLIYTLRINGRAIPISNLCLFALVPSLEAYSSFKRNSSHSRRSWQRILRGLESNQPPNLFYEFIRLKISHASIKSRFMLNERVFSIWLFHRNAQIRSNPYWGFKPDHRFITFLMVVSLFEYGNKTLKHFKI